MAEVQRLSPKWTWHHVFSAATVEDGPARARPAHHPHAIRPGRRVSRAAHVLGGAGGDRRKFGNCWRSEREARRLIGSTRGAAWAATRLSVGRLSTHAHRHPLPGPSHRSSSALLDVARHRARAHRGHRPAHRGHDARRRRSPSRVGHRDPVRLQATPCEASERPAGSAAAQVSRRHCPAIVSLLSAPLFIALSSSTTTDLKRRTSSSCAWR
jgi:hypothetical protein